MIDSRPKGRGFEPHRRHCVVVLEQDIYPGLVLVQPRKNRPYITERLLMGRKESNQTKSLADGFWSSLLLADIFWSSLSLVDVFWSSTLLADGFWSSLSLADGFWSSLSLADDFWSSLSLGDSSWSSLFLVLPPIG